MKGKRRNGAKSWMPGVNLSGHDKAPSLGLHAKAMEASGSGVRPRADKKSRGMKK